MGVTGAEVSAIAAAIVLIAIVIAFLYYVRQRADRRKQELLGELADSRERVEDRAHNQIRLARHEARLLAAEGTDVSAPDRRLAEAEASLARHDGFHALQIARSVHDGLVQTRQRSLAMGGSSSTFPRGGALPSSATHRPGEIAGPPTLSLDAPSDGLEELEPLGSPPPGAPPKNRLEAQFQLGLVDGELAEADRSRPNEAEVSEAKRIVAQARARQSEGEFTDALRLALKARRTLGGRVESLPPVRSAPAAASTSSAAPAAGADSGRRCRGCGRPVSAADQFCRSCGSPVGALRCPRCASTLGGSDLFCGTCGSPVSAR